MKINPGIAFNIVFWLLYFLYQWLGLASLYQDYDKYFINACLALPVALLFSLLTVHVLFKQFYTKGKREIAWALMIVCSLLLLFVRRTINYYFIYPTYFPQALWTPFFSFGKWLIELVNLYTITGLYALYYFIRSWYQERDRVQVLVQQQTMAQLGLLKAQVQPHFVFNMLNTIYASTLPASPETAALVAHLSGFLDYNLYDASKDTVSLSAEINYLQHYIELQKSRVKDKLDVSINIYGNTRDLEIAPLLLLPLVENCFKHGVAQSTGQSWVRIDIAAEAQQLSVKIENSKEVDGPSSTGPSGIGLVNVRKRLELLYPGAHAFKIRAETNTYLVIMEIKYYANGKVYNR